MNYYIAIDRVFEEYLTALKMFTKSREKHYVQHHDYVKIHQHRKKILVDY